MCINSYINKYIFIIITNKIVKMHNNRNINTYIYYLDKHKKRVIGQKALLISEDTNKAIYIIYALSTTQWHIPHTPPMQQIIRYRPL